MKTKQELQESYDYIRAHYPPDIPDHEYRLLREAVNNRNGDQGQMVYILLEALIEAYRRIDALEQRLGDR